MKFAAVRLTEMGATAPALADRLAALACDASTLRREPARRLSIASGICAAAILLSAGATSSIARGILPPGPTFNHNFSSPADVNAPGALIHFGPDATGLLVDIAYLDLREPPPQAPRALPMDGTPIFDHAIISAGFEARQSRDPPIRRQTADLRADELLITGPSSSPPPGTAIDFTIQMTKLSLSGGTMTGDWVLRVSPTLISDGRLTATPVRGNTDWSISGYMSLNLELSTDGGISWLPASGPLHMDYIAVPAPGAAALLGMLAPLAARRRRA